MIEAAINAKMKKGTVAFADLALDRSAAKNESGRIQSARVNFTVVATLSASLP